MLVLVVTLGLCFLGEAVLRVRFYLQYGTFLRVHTFEKDPVSGLSIPVPGRDTGAIRIDSRGFRNPELELPKPAGRVRLAFLGASTTYCAEASSNEATWPSLVCDGARRAHPTASIDYVNAGVAGYVLSHVAKNLEFRVRPLQPDVIVLYEATNDLTKDTRELAQEQGVYVEHSDREDWLAQISLLWHLIEKNLLVRTRANEATSGAARVKLDLPRLEKAYRERYVALVRDAQKVAPVVAVVTFAQRTRRGMSADELRASCVTHFYYMPYMDAESVIEGFEAYNRAIRAAAAETGAILIEGEDGVPPDATHFTDSVHFTDAGCRWQAERVWHGLETAPAFRNLFGPTGSASPR